jgi:hypothetical protein
MQSMKKKDLGEKGAISGKSLLLAYKINDRLFYTSPPPRKNIDAWLSI